MILELDRRYRVEVTITDTATEDVDWMTRNKLELKAVDYFYSDISSDSIEHDSELIAALTAAKIYHYVDNHLDANGKYVGYVVKEF